MAERQLEQGVEPATSPARKRATRRVSVWWRWLGLVVVVGFGIRIGYILGWWDPLKLVGDAVYYHVGANLLADGKGFLHPIEVAFNFRETPGADHPPAYIIYLAVASKVGFRTALGHQVWSAVLGTATIVIVALTGRRLGGQRVGLIAAGLAAVSPSMWMPDSGVMAETLAIFTTSLVLLAAYRCWEQPRPMSGALLGAALGLAALTRSELLLLAPLIVVPLVWFRRKEAARPLAVFVTAAVVTAATIAPWALHNLSRFDEPVLLSNQLDRTMAASWCDETFEGPWIGYKSYECLRRADAGAATPAARRENNERAWKRYADKHVAQVPVVTAARAGRMWGLFRPFQQLDAETPAGAPSAPAVGGMIATWVLLAVGAVGLWRLRARSVPVFPLVAPIIVVTAVAALTFGQLRYRAPAEPALILLAAVALGPLVPSWLRRGS